MGLGLATPVDSHHPASARAIEARWFALPTPIKNKLRDLEARRDALHGACDSLRSRLLALRAELSEKAQRLKHALANASPETRFGVTGTDPWSGGSGSGVATWGGLPGPERQQELDRLAEDLRRLETLATEARRRWEAAARCHESAREWLEATEIAAVVPVVVKYERPADPRAEVEAMRAKLAALDRDAAAVERAPIPTAEALQRLDALARDAAARVATRREQRARGFFAPSGVRDVGALFGLVQGFSESPRELAEAIRERCEEDLLANLKAWKEALKAQAVTGEPVASAERPKRLAAITRQRHELEQREEQLVLSAERDGLDLDRRADASPALVLCVTLAAEAA